MKRMSRLGFFIFTAIVLIALLSPFLGTRDTNTFSLAEKFAGPSSHAWFGLDQNGADVYSQVLFGARTSLLISFVVVSLSSAIGLTLASWSTYRGGVADLVLSLVRARAAQETR